MNRAKATIILSVVTSLNDDHQNIGRTKYTERVDDAGGWKDIEVTVEGSHWLEVAQVATAIGACVSMLGENKILIC